jgi:hypothetical protein
MSRSDDKSHAVGYGRPPQRTRWKKGQSGNPRHKKRRAREGTLAILDRLLMHPVQIMVNGEVQKMSALEAIITQLIQKDLSGNARAASVLRKYRQLASQSSEKKFELTFVDSDYTRALATRPLETKDNHE